MKYITVNSVLLLFISSCDTGIPEERGTANLLLEHKFRDKFANVYDYTTEGRIIVCDIDSSSYQYILCVYDPNTGEWEEVANVTSTKGFSDARYSPDRSKIAYKSDYKVFVMDSDGDNVEPILTDSLYWLFGWLDNDRVIFRDGPAAWTKLYTKDVNTGDIELLIDFSDTFIVGEMSEHGYLAISPKGTKFVYSYWVRPNYNDPKRWHTVIYDDIEHQRYTTFDCEEYGYSSQFSPNSNCVVYARPFGSTGSEGTYEEYGTEIYYYDLTEKKMYLFYRSHSLTLEKAGWELWPGPFWNADGSAVISYLVEDDGTMKIYEITPG